MIERPQFKPHIHVEIVKDEGVFLVSEIGHSVLNGRLFELVSPLIDGRRSADEIAAELQPQASLAQVYYALMQLERKGYLSESDRTFPLEEAAFWSVQNTPSQTAAQRLAETEVTVSVFGGVAVQPFLTLLESSRVRVGEGGQFGVVLTDDYLRQELQSYNKVALQRSRPWILIKPVGSQILIGPVFFPGQTGCWECLARRLRMNRAVEIFVQSKQHRDDPFPIPSAATPATQQIAYGIAANEIATWIVRTETPLSGQVLSVDVLSWKSQLHPLIRQPHCPACRDSVPALEQPALVLELKSRKETFTDEGGHRVVGPEETLQKYERHVSPITGAVSGLQRHVVANDGVMHVYVAGENFAGSHYNLRHLQGNLRSRS